MTSETIRSYRINPRFSWKKLAAGCVLLDLEHGSYFTLNETASHIWQGIADGQSPEAIAKSLATAYEVPTSRIDHDIETTISYLVKEGILEHPCSAVEKQHSNIKRSP